jgi:hypothetical protein
MADSAVKIPFIEAAAPSTPAANRVVIYCKADGLMYSKDDAGVETLMSAGSGSGIPATIFDAKGDIIAASAADTAARLAASGTNDFVLTAASGEATGLKWAVPLLSTIEYVLAAKVDLTTAGSYYQGPNGTPAAGTYLCLGIVTFLTGGTGNRGFTSRITTGGSVASGILTGGTNIDEKETDAPSAAGNMYQCATTAIVTLNGSTTISLTASTATATVDDMVRVTQSNSPALTRATVLTLVRIGT